MLIFYKQQSHFSQINSKSQNKNYYLLIKIPKITILFWILVFRFMYLVSVYPTIEQTKIFSPILSKKNQSLLFGLILKEIKT